MKVTPGLPKEWGSLIHHLVLWPDRLFGRLVIKIAPVGRHRGCVA
jgi:hypothetical protein